uniref:Uncharacterized protein n=1 Tax=viral metagenome TaxID=1070528 RepID=A0A6C0M222_9ZZZZ
MRGGGKADKEVTDALRSAIQVMNENNTFPELAGALTKLANIADKKSAAVADTVAVATPTAVAESENDVHHTVNAAASTDSSTVNAAASTDSSTVNAAASTDSSTVNAAASTDSSTVNAIAATNEPNAELTEKSVIHYGTDSKQTSSTYLEIKKRLDRMINKPNNMNPDNIPIETLKSRLEEITNAKTIPEVTAILQKYKFNDTYPLGKPAFLRFTMTMGGGSRKHKMRKIKNQYTSK